MNTSAPLKSLTITNFRGSRNTFVLPFEKGRKLTLVYGENGTGKTTICDALAFLATEKVRSLEGQGLGGRLEKFWPTVGQAPESVSIILETAGGTCSGAIVSKTVQVLPTGSQPRIELLRRQQITSLIEAQPADRYLEIQRFIDTAPFEKSEQALRELCKSIAAESERARQAERQSRSELKRFFDNDANPHGADELAWAKKKVDEPAGGHDGDITALQLLETAFHAFKNLAERSKERSAAVSACQVVVTNTTRDLAEASKAVTDGAVDKLKVLEVGRSYFTVHPSAAECPLCLTEHDPARLSESITVRLDSLQQLQAATYKHQEAEKALGLVQATLVQLDSEYAKAAEKYAQAKDARAWPAEVKLPKHALPSTLDQLADWLTVEVPTTETWPEIRNSWREKSQLTATLKAAYESYEQNVAICREFDALLPRLEQALNYCVEQRQAFTTRIIGEIAREVGELYEKVHPGEGLDTIALPLDPKKRASIELQAKFSGQDVPPQAYFSQSHLDTLGLCVFLALAARDRPSETILILDDVLGSVDEPHVERIISLIYDASLQFRHTMVTTHYRPWREKYRWGWLKPNQQCQFVELTSWSLSGGMALTGSTPEIARLKTMLTDPEPDVQSVCGKAGVILEALLDFLTLKYGCAVPRKFDGRYEVGDLLSAVNGKLLAALKAESIVHSEGVPSVVAATELKPILDEITSLAKARNVLGAHFNEIAFHLYPADGIRFAMCVERLADLLICADHGWPTKDSSGSYWSNGGDTRRLHPLKKPA